MGWKNEVKVFGETEFVSNSIVLSTKEEAEAYRNFLAEDERFAKLSFKVEPYHEHVFPRVTVKVRLQLAALDCQLDPSSGAEPISPKKSTNN